MLGNSALNRRLPSGSLALIQIIYGAFAGIYMLAEDLFGEDDEEDAVIKNYYHSNKLAKTIVDPPQKTTSPVPIKAINRH